jgi:hypothetical protein
MPGPQLQVRRGNAARALSWKRASGKRVDAQHRSSNEAIDSAVTTLQHDESVQRNSALTVRQHDEGINVDRVYDSMEFNGQAS